MIHSMRADFVLRGQFHNICPLQRGNVFVRLGNIKSAFDPVFCQHFRKLEVQDTAVVPTGGNNQFCHDAGLLQTNSPGATVPIIS